MTSKTIRISVGVATLLLAGIIVTQIYWVRQAFIREEIDFERNVNLALYETAQNFYKISEITAPRINPIVKLSPNNYVVMLNSPIDANLLEILLKTSFSLHNLYTNFSYGIYETISTNKVYESSVEASPEELLEPKTELTELPVFTDMDYYFSVNFTTKRSFLRSRMQIWMYSTIVLLVVILFFAYTLLVVLKQKRLSEVQKDFINNMTHEFKTPISTIEIAVGVLKDPSIKNNPERMVKYATIIDTENQRLKKQVDKVLQIANLDRVKIQLNKVPLNMHELLNNVVGQVNESLKKGKIITDFRAREYEINGDVLHITNIVYNLLDNAVKYGPESPEILVSTANTAKEFILSIKDNGVGISKDHQKHIFDKFYRVPTGNIHNVKGFGIGLHYVQLIAEAHGGFIKVESEPDKGSTFTINLPI